VPIVVQIFIGVYFGKVELEINDIIQNQIELLFQRKELKVMNPQSIYSQ
jgi:hypothetical protein